MRNWLFNFKNQVLSHKGLDKSERTKQKWAIAKIARVTFLYRNISPMWSADHSSSIMEETEEERICAKVIFSIMAKVEMEDKIST